MIDLILEKTNAKIAKILDNAPEELLSRESLMKETFAIEIRAFIDLLIKGLYKLKTFRIARLFSERYGPPIFSATMSWNRLFFILANLSFDDEETRADR